MITSSQVLTFLKACPFRPFRIPTVNGKVYDINRPDLAKVGKDFLLVLICLTLGDDFADHHTCVALSHIESILLIRPPVDIRPIADHTWPESLS